MEEKKSNLRWLYIGLLFFMNAIGFSSINCIPPLFLEMSSQIAMTKAQLGTLMGVILISSFIFAPLGGGLSDKLGSRFAAGTAVIIAGLGGFMRGYMDSFTGLVICNVIIGSGIAFFAPNMPKVVGTWFASKELALANGLCMAGMGVGGAIAMAISTSILSPALGGWRGAVQAIGGTVMVLGLAWIVLYRDRKVEGATKKPKQSMGKNFKKVLKVRDLNLLLIYRGFNMIGFFALITFLPSALQERGMANGGQLVSIMMGLSVVFNVIGSGISDRVGLRKPFLTVTTFLFGICIITFTTLSGIPLIISLVIAGASMGTLAPIVFILPVEFKEIGPGLAATAVGLMLMVGNTLGFVGPIIAGKLIDVSGSNFAGFVFMSAACIIAGFFVLPIRETGSRKKKGQPETNA